MSISLLLTAGPFCRHCEWVQQDEALSRRLQYLCYKNLAALELEARAFDAALRHFASVRTYLGGGRQRIQKVLADSKALVFLFSVCVATGA